MERIVSTRPKVPPGVVHAASAVGVAAVIGAGAWVVAYGLPNREGVSWVVLIGTVTLLGLVAAGWRYVDARRVGLLQRCLIVSVLLHVLIAAGFSAVVVVQQVARVVRGEEPLTPSVNLSLSREMEVREQVRQQVAVDLPVAPPMPSLVRAESQSPLPAMTDALQPVGLPELPWRQIAAQQAPVSPTIPTAPPAPELLTPMLPVRADIAPMPAITPIPASVGVDTARAVTHIAGPITEQLAARPTTPLAGLGAGSLGAPPAALPFGPSSGGTATGSGTGSGLSVLASAMPPRLVDLPPATVSVPAPSLPALAPPRGAAGFDPLPGRSFDERQRAIEKFGGSPETEAAVARALLYLSRVQGGDGRWTKIGGDGKPSDEHDVGLTSLSVLCYLAANHTPTADGPYRDVVRKGIGFLQSVQKVNGDLRGAGNMYDHAIAALALGEAAAMTRDRKLRDAAHRGAQFILDAQNNAGAWRYKPKDWFSDTSVTGWQIMALHSAERTGFKVDDSVKLRALKYLGTVSRGQHGMLTGYLSAEPTLTMTAEAVFTRMLCGQVLSQEALAEATAFMEAPTREKLDYYYVYYGSLAQMQMQGEGWKRWNAATSRLLIGLQQKTGREAGVFPEAGEWTDRGGKVYTTTLATLSLEVYYRYLPMYAK